MSDTQQETSESRQWFLRTGGESIFGPVSTQGLVVWAEQGRILPGHEVSNDRKKWVQAVSLAMLDMRWFVDDGSGELRGPLNKLAAEALIKSGKVPEGSQLVSSDDIETPAEVEKSAAAPAEKNARDQVPEDVLRVRVRELESMVTVQRERLAKLANADAIETVQHERDVLSSLVKELEAQRESILKNAEKDMRTAERKMEQLRQQIRKQEQQLEEANSRLLQSDEAAAAAGEARREVEDREQMVERVRGEMSAQLLQLTKDSEGLRVKLAETERQNVELRRTSDETQAALEQTCVALKSRVAALEQAVDFHEKRDAEARQILSTREEELAVAGSAVQAATRKACEAEAAFAELLRDANARDNAYAEKIAALEKACAQPPEETARFFSDQAAVYEMVKMEVEELTKTMEQERSNIEQLKELSVQRQQALQERRQTLLKQLGSSPVEMTRRAVREKPSDPNAVRVRTELDNLRIAHERELRLAEDRDRDQQRKLRVLEAEATKLQGLAAEGERMGRRLQDVSELLRRREQELADERKNREAEREQFQGSQQALLMRIESLEKASRGGTPDEIQSADARNVKIATWMRLKK